MDILRIYMILFVICFIVTCLLLTAFVAAGDRLEKLDYKNGAIDTYTRPTRKDWMLTLMKISMIAAIISVVAPLTLLAYAVVLVIAVIGLLSDRENTRRNENGNRSGNQKKSGANSAEVSRLQRE